MPNSEPDLFTTSFPTLITDNLPEPNNPAMFLCCSPVYAGIVEACGGRESKP